MAEGDYDKGKCFGVHSERLKIHPCFSDVCQKKVSHQSVWG